MKFFVKTKLSDNISETPEGFLLCRNVPLSHTGALHYAKGEHPFEDVDEVTIKREAKELFSPATMASFEGKDITIQHPDEFVAPDNYQELTNGVMFNLRKSKTNLEVEGEICEVLMCDFLIKTSEAIEMVKNGEREVSLGYEADWELISEDEGRHSNIRGNHCALVQAGRAGKHCAINDHKKEKTIMGKEALERFKKLFGKTVDEAMKEKEDAEKAKDEDKDKLIKDLQAKIADLEKEEEVKEEGKEKEEEKKEESKDEGDVESRLSKLEAMLEKLLSKMSGEDSEEEESEEIVADEDEEESEDSMEGIEGEDSEEEEKEEKKNKAKDSVMSRAEILAPGISKSKDIVKEALKKAYGTADGKKVIDSLTDGKGISKLTKETEVVVFNAAAEALKAKRVGDFASQKILTIDSFPNLSGKGSVSAEDINAKNKAHYGIK